MISAKQAAAVAMILIIAIPLLAGYAFASDTVEKDVVKLDQSANVSERLMNSGAPYFSEYSGPNNNSLLTKLTAVHFNNEHSYAFYFVNPDYVTTSSTASSVEISTLATANSTQSAYVDLSSDGADAFVFNVTSPGYGNLTSYPYMYLYPNQSLTYSYVIDSVWSSSVSTEHDLVLLASEMSAANTPERFDLYDFSSDPALIASDIKGFRFSFDDGVIMKFRNTADAAPTVGGARVASYSVNYGSPYFGLAVLEMSDGSWKTVPVINQEFNLTKQGTTVYVGGDVYFGVTSAYVLTNWQNNTFTANYYKSGSGVYADVADGWTQPQIINYWANTNSNGSVVFYAHLEPGEDCQLSPVIGSPSLGYETYTELYAVSDESGIVSVRIGENGGTSTLGKYEYLRFTVDLQAGTASIAGIAAWPSMGQAATVYNAVSESLDIQNETFSHIELSNASRTVEWRCDSAQIVAGTFPATEDYTLNLGDLYPGYYEYSVKLNSIGIYGDSITIGGVTYAVTDGTIDVDGQTISLRNATIYWEMVNHSLQFPIYFCKINDVYVGMPLNDLENADIFKIGFGGLWSLTATANMYASDTVTSNEWVPGVFAFDKDSLILMIILVAAAVFVALGFTAGRSGGKVLLLAIACGGASVIALILV